MYAPPKSMRVELLIKIEKCSAFGDSIYDERAGKLKFFGNCINHDRETIARETSEEF